MVVRKPPARPYRRLIKRLEGVLQSAHETGKLTYVRNLSDLRRYVREERLAPSVLEDVKKALHIVAFKSQQFFNDAQSDSQRPLADAIRDYERRFGHLPVNYEVENASRAWFDMPRHTPVRIENKCVANSGAMAVLLYALTGRIDRLGFTAIPGHVSTTFRLNGVPHVVHAFGVQPLSAFKSDLVAASTDAAHPLRALAENGGLHYIRPVTAYLDRYMSFAEGRAANRLRRTFALTNRAIAHAVSGNLSDAEKFAQEARKLARGDDRPLALLSRIYYHQNRPVAARQAAEEAIRLNPLNPDAHHRLGLALRAEKKYAAAIRAFDASLAIRPDYALTHEAQQEAWSRWTRESGLFKGILVDSLRSWRSFKERFLPVLRRA